MPTYSITFTHTRTCEKRDRQTPELFPTTRGPPITNHYGEQFILIKALPSVVPSHACTAWPRTSFSLSWRFNRILYRSPRIRATTRPMMATVSSISDSVVVAPKLKRRLLATNSSARPIAIKTGEGSLDPLAHAEPVEQATPSRSSAITSARRSRPENETLLVCGKRSALAELTTLFGTAERSRVSNRSRSAVMRFSRSQNSRAKSSSASACRPRARPAPCPAASPLLHAAVHERPQCASRHVATHQQTANAARSVELVCRERKRGCAEVVEVDRQLADDLHRVGVQGN